MSIASHLVAAVVGAGALLGVDAMYKLFMEPKLVRSANLDVRMSRQNLRTCGVKKLRASPLVDRLMDDGTDGLMIYLRAPDAPSFVSAKARTPLRVRLDTGWPEASHSYAMERHAIGRLEEIAEVLAASPYSEAA